jgi:hypothetical protein
MALTWEHRVALGVENALSFIRSASRDQSDLAKPEVIASLVIVEAALKMLLKELHSDVER